MPNLAFGQFVALQVSPIVGGLLGLMLVALGARTSALRARYSVRLGDGGHADLGDAIRAHGNLVEHAMPLLVLLLIWELQGASHLGRVIVGGAIVLARVLHAAGFMRPALRTHVPGAALTYLLEVVLSCAVIYRAL